MRPRLRFWIRTLERLASITLSGVSIIHACKGEWPAAQYFIMFAAALELEEWIHG